MAGPSMTPPSKRMKLDHVSPNANNDQLIPELDADVDEDHCTICLQPIADRAVISTCSHEFCFECLMIWSDQSRRCPLCAQNIGDYLIHHIRSTYDYQKHFLPPLRTSPRPLSRADGARIALVHRRRERVWGARDRAAQDEADALERAVSWRRWIYQHDLYAKHVASNKYTRYRPFPTPAQFATSQDLISRMTVFLRRELLVWPNADVEFLVTFVISLMKSIDIRSESAIRLLAEFLDMDAAYVPGERQINAEHFAHEIYCYLRSPYRDLGVYDSVVQYDVPPGISLPPSHKRTRRWESAASQSRSPSPNVRQLPPSIRQGHSRNERRPRSHAHLRGRESRRSISLDNLIEDSRIPHDISVGEDDEDGSPGAQPCSRSHPRAKSKGKQRAPARSPTPPPESVICGGTPTVHHERMGSLEIGTASSSTSFFINDPERSTAAGSSPAGDVHFGEASPHEAPESNSGHSPDVSPQFPNGDRSKPHKTPATDKPHLPILEGLHSSNDGIIASSSSISETSKHPTINRNARANPIIPMRQSRYRSQRDSINAYLRKASAMTPRPPSSAPLRSVPSLLTRVTDEMVANPNFTASGADADITQASWDGNARLSPHMAELSSRPSVDDDPSERREEATMTKAESESGAALPPPSHACLLHVEKATAVEAGLRKQVRLRVRLAAERSLARDD